MVEINDRQKNTTKCTVTNIIFQNSKLSRKETYEDIIQSNSSAMLPFKKRMQKKLSLSFVTGLCTKMQNY